MEQEKYEFKLLKPEIKNEIINNLKLSKNKLDLVKAIVYYIAPHDQSNINDTELNRLGKEHRRIRSVSMEYEKKVKENPVPPEQIVDKFTKTKNRVVGYEEGINKLSGDKEKIKTTIKDIDETIKKIDPNKKK